MSLRDPRLRSTGTGGKVPKFTGRVFYEVQREVEADTAEEAWRVLWNTPLKSEDAGATALALTVLYEDGSAVTFCDSCGRELPTPQDEHTIRHDDEDETVCAECKERWDREGML